MVGKKNPISFSKDSGFCIFRHRLTAKFDNFFTRGPNKAKQNGEAACGFNSAVRRASDSVVHLKHKARQLHRSRIYEEGI